MRHSAPPIPLLAIPLPLPHARRALRRPHAPCSLRRPHPRCVRAGRSVERSRRLRRVRGVDTAAISSGSTAHATAHAGVAHSSVRCEVVTRLLMARLLMTRLLMTRLLMTRLLMARLLMTRLLASSLAAPSLPVAHRVRSLPVHRSRVSLVSLRSPLRSRGSLISRLGSRLGSRLESRLGSRPSPPSDPNGCARVIWTSRRLRLSSSVDGRSRGLSRLSALSSDVRQGRSQE